MQVSINEVKEQIDEVNLSLLETDKIIREIEWENFDYLQDRISRITSEADFLIELLSSEDLFTEEGKLTDEGMATMGLHGTNYNTYMAQADKYASEIQKLNEEIANDPNNTELIERKEELIDLQQKSILAAEAEKQAMVDLVREGIELEIESLSKLIDTYEESLDSAKRLHDYNNKISDQTTEISNIRKQIAAYEGNDSEEARATLQKLRTELSKAERDLEETEYDKYISDQKSLLDSLMTEYEEVLNNRLDDVNALISETVDTINSNSDLINDTINNAASDVGYTISDNMQDIWSNSTSSIEGIISTYGDGFNQHLTSIQAVISHIDTSVSEMVAESNQQADETIKNTNPVTKPDDDAKSPVTDKPKEEPDKKPSDQPKKEITIGGKINAGNATIYTNDHGGGGGKQYFSSDPIYTVLDESNGYLQVRHHTKTSGVTGWFKKSDVKAYKKGGLVDYTGTAWVDGTTSKPEAFLSAQDTANFISLKNVLEEMRQRGLTIGSAGGYNSSALQFTNLSDISELLSSIRSQRIDKTENSIGDIQINIPIDHVQDYNDFVTKMRDDDTFEKMVQSMTIDRLVGGSSLSKNKHRW